MSPSIALVVTRVRSRTSTTSAMHSMCETKSYPTLLPRGLVEQHLGMGSTERFGGRMVVRSYVLAKLAAEGYVQEERGTTVTSLRDRLIKRFKDESHYEQSREVYQLANTLADAALSVFIEALGLDIPTLRAVCEAARGIEIVTPHRSGCEGKWMNRLYGRMLCTHRPTPEHPYSGCPAEARIPLDLLVSLVEAAE